MEIFKVRSVCNKYGEIKGEFREPQIEVIAGSEDTMVNYVKNQGIEKDYTKLYEDTPTLFDSML